jgi:hypothetical protein
MQQSKNNIITMFKNKILDKNKVLNNDLFITDSRIARRAYYDFTIKLSTNVDKHFEPVPKTVTKLLKYKDIRITYKNKTYTLQDIFRQSTKVDIRFFGKDCLWGDKAHDTSKGLLTITQSIYNTTGMQNFKDNAKELFITCLVWYNPEDLSITNISTGEIITGEQIKKQSEVSLMLKDNKNGVLKETETTLFKIQDIDIIYNFIDNSIRLYILKYFES